MNIREEVINVLIPIFGESIRAKIENYYDSKNPDELVNLAYHIIEEYAGEERAKKLLKNLLEQSQLKKSI